MIFDVCKRPASSVKQVFKKIFLWFKMKALKYVLLLNFLAENAFLQSSISDVSEAEKFMATIVNCDVEFEEPCSSGKILFHIYTNISESESPNGITASDHHLPFLFDKRKETKIIIHGFLGNVDSKDSAFIREVYRQENNFNLVVVDWGQLAKLPCYPTAVFSTWQAGKCTAAFLENFITDKNLTRVHAIGFSLGAHVAGFASNLLKQKLKKQLGRITGLDPALPFFASLDNAMKLDENDGNFVDVIHTNIGVFGKIEPTGHVDFYMNGGFYQPACHNARNIPLCSHLMAILYYAESVTDLSKGFWGVPCKSHFHYLIGLCFESNAEERVLMGDKCDSRYWLKQDWVGFTVPKSHCSFIKIAFKNEEKVQGNLFCKNKKRTSICLRLKEDCFFS